MPKRIMIIDDDLVSRSILRDILETAGHQVVAEAASGEEALEKYRGLLVDLLFIDIVLPGRNGLDLANDLLAKDRNARIVLVSVLDDLKLIRAGFTLGAVDFIHKPFHAERVLLAVQRG